MAELQQDPARNSRICAIVEQLHVDLAGFSTGDTRNILDIERDLYVADIWTTYVEPKLRNDGDRFAELANALLDLLLRNPKSEQVQTLLDLLHSDTTPAEIALSLEGGKGRIECEPRPRALASISIAFKITDPLLREVDAVRRLLAYGWNTGDATTVPASVDRFRHYFKMPWSLRSSAPGPSYEVAVDVRVPFCSAAGPFAFETTVTPHRGKADWWKVEPMEIASFLISAAIAVATAFGTQYSSDLPDVVTSSVGLTAFMLGFGLDQLRDTISPAAAPTNTGV